MSALKALLQARKAAQGDGNDSQPVVQADVAPVRVEAQPAKVVSSPAQGSVETPRVQNPFARRFGARVESVSQEKSEAKADSATAIDDETSPEEDEDDLSDLEEKTPYHSQFPDETPASAPTREVPADAEKGMKQFVDLIDGVYSILDDPEMLSNVIRSIMIELKANPQYMRQVTKTDVRTWVRAMRDSMGLARIRKQEKKTTRSGSGASKAGKVMDKDMADAFADLGLDLSNL